MVGVAACRRRWVVVLVALSAVASAMLLAAPAAWAHAVLESSSPSAGEVIGRGVAIGRVELVFDESVEVSLGAIQVVAAGGSRVDMGAVRHVDGAGNRVAVGVRANLGEGSYLTGAAGRERVGQRRSADMSRRAGQVIGDGVAHDSVTGRPAAMSVASWCSFADGRRTPKGVSELRSRCWMWAVGRPCWLCASERSTAPA